MIIDRAYFFDHIRGSLFRGKLDQPQVDNLGTILGEWERWSVANADMNPNARWIGYALATTFHETAMTMQPVAEVGEGKGHDYGVPDPVTGQIYYGRGYPQLTWKANYQVQGARLGIDMEHEPDLMLSPSISANVLIHGMAHGTFTGRRLGRYFGADPKRDNPVAARAIINGSDKAALVASYHQKFMAAIRPATINQTVQI